MIFRSSMRGLCVVIFVLAGCVLVGAAACRQQATSRAESPQAAARPRPHVEGEPDPHGSGSESSAHARPAEGTATAEATPAGSGSDASAHPPLVVVFLGDSLTAGLGVAQDLAFPALIEAKLEGEGMLVHVINAGVSGDTTAGGLSRLDWLLGQKPDVIVVELGANDGLRALPIEEVRTNLRKIVARAKASGAAVLLVGMLIPTNYGPDYGREFAGIYPALAREMKLPLVPFLLDGVAGRPELNQEDGIHPTADGHRHIAETVLPYLREILRAKQRK